MITDADIKKIEAAAQQAAKDPDEGDDKKQVEVKKVVKKVEHGYVLRSFGNIKGLLTFEDIKQKDESLSYKIGSIVKGYVLFKK